MLNVNAICLSIATVFSLSTAVASPQNPAAGPTCTLASEVTLMSSDDGRSLVYVATPSGGAELFIVGGENATKLASLGAETVAQIASNYKHYLKFNKFAKGAQFVMTCAMAGVTLGSLVRLGMGDSQWLPAVLLGLPATAFGMFTGSVLNRNSGLDVLGQMTVSEAKPLGFDAQKFDHLLMGVMNYLRVNHSVKLFN